MPSSKEKPLAVFTSKADTLMRLSQLLVESSIEELYSFTEQEWQESGSRIIEVVKAKFKGKTIIVRSSALSEDTLKSSNAGAFRSIHYVDSADSYSISSAVNDVIASYREKGASNPRNPILIQTQTSDVDSSGITLTRDFNGAPYYLINYSEGNNTAAVTSGLHSKALRVLRSAQVGYRPPLSDLIRAVREIESLALEDQPLDIEYAVKKNGQIVTFQVRPLPAVNKPEDGISDDEIFDNITTLKRKFRDLIQRRAHLAGETTYFGDMPDWNPAEIIGSSPHLLAASLYDEIITGKVWHQARTSQGYTDVDPARLVVLFGNKPYVDVRNSFNAMVPAELSPNLREKLVAFYLDKLSRNPHLQDKVEFEILFTCYDLSFEQRSRELLETGFYPEEVSELRTALLRQTNDLLDVTSIRDDIHDNEQLEEARKLMPSLTLLP